MSFLGNKQREDELFYALAHELLPTEEVAATSEAKVENVESALASVIVTLVKCAEKLEDLGHPGAEHVNKLLAFIEKDFLKEAGAKQVG